MNILVITDSPSPYKVTFLEMMSKYHTIDILFQNKSYSHRDKSWFKTSENINSRYLNEKKLTRFRELISINVKRYDLFWNMNYTSWECMLMAIRFRLSKRTCLMHADGGIYKDFGFVLNTAIHFAMNLNHYFTSSGIMTTQYYLGNRVNKDKIFNYHFSSILAKDIEFNYISKDNTKSDTVFEILAIGQQIHRKGFDVLLKSIADINNIHLTIIGGKPNEECVNILNDLKLDRKVTFVEFVQPNVLKKYYLSSDLFVLPTREDIWGLVMNEAMAYGLPLISTKNCVAAVEFEHNYHNCICVDVDDVNGLKDAIVKVICNNELREQMKANSRKFANQITIDQMVEDYLEIFEKLKGNNDEGSVY